MYGNYFNQVLKQLYTAEICLLVNILMTASILPIYEFPIVPPNVQIYLTVNYMNLCS